MKRHRNDDKNPGTRTWCKFCELWVADNRAQREQHENGARHKKELARKLKDIAQRNEQRRAEERKVAATTSAAKLSRGQDIVELAWGVATKVEPVQSYDVTTDGAVCDIQNETTLLQGEETGANVPGGFVNDTAASVDENGFPLPATAVYGQWEEVEEKATEDNAEEGYDGSREIGSGKSGGDEDTVDKTEDDEIVATDERLTGSATLAVVEETTRNEDLDVRETETRKEADDTVRLAAASAFKKRKVPSKSRKSSIRSRR